MMKKAYVAAVLSATIVVSGCQSMSEADQQAMGAGVGAALGCGVGLLIGGRAENCLAGAAAGGLLGWGVVKINQYQTRQLRSAESDRRVYGLSRPVDSTQIKIRKGTSSPRIVRAGQDVKIATDYSVMLPPNEASTKVTESWVLKKDGKVMSTLATRSRQRAAGGWGSSFDLPIPGDAAPGTYVVEHKIKAGSSYDEDESTFTVRG